MEINPTIHGVFGDAFALVDQAADNDLSHYTQTCAGWTGSRGLVKREVCHAHFRYLRAAMRTRICPIGAFVGFRLKGVPGIVGGFIGGRWNILSALGTGA